MSEILTIDTGVEELKQKQEMIEPLPVYGDSHPMLHTEVPLYDEHALPSPVIDKLAARLNLTRKLYNGFGLSANQCGVMERIFVIGTQAFQMTCINPKILEYRGKEEKMREACLSYPGLSLYVNRNTSILVEYYDTEGTRVETELSGITAQCFQHELDHLNGISFTAKVGPVALQLAKKKQEKLIKKLKRMAK